VNRRAGLGVAATLILAVACPGRATAQLYLPLPQRYLLTTDASDGRAVWVNPAGLARRVEASLGLDATVERRPGSTRLSQFGATVRSRNLAFGWTHDAYGSGSAANNLALGVGLGDARLSIGVTRLWYGGPGGDKAWDMAVRARATALLDLSLVWRNVGSPTVREITYDASIIPAAALHLLEGRVVAGAEWDLASGLDALREVRLGATCVVAAGVAISIRGDFSPGAARRGFAVGVTVGTGRTRSTLVTLLPPNANSIEAIGASTALIATEPASQRR
jgi:hypothetical protein